MDSPLEGDGFEPVWGFSCQAVVLGCGDKTVAASIIERAGRLPRSIGEKCFTDMARYDAGRLTSSLASLRVPVMALQTTFLNEKKREDEPARGADHALHRHAPRQRSFCPRHA
jgi:hypothetical protein